MDLADLTVDPALVRAVGDRYGIDLDDAAAREWAEDVASSAAVLAGIDSTELDSERAREVDEGTDEHNAIRYAFELPAGDGPLSGLEVGVKDNLAVAGVPMTCGSGALEYEPDHSATVVERLRTAGASVVATTNMDEFAYFTTGETCAHGPVENPEAPGRVPGGSSAGSGAAVAAGDLDAALGSDTGGSVRIPASFCGVVGLKPTYGAVSRFGFADLGPSLDHVGPLAPDVETAARVFEAIAGPDPRDRSSLFAPSPAGVAEAVDTDVEGTTVGLIEPAISAATPEVAEVVEAALEDLVAGGATVEETPVEGYPDAPLVLAPIAGAEFARLMDAAGQVYGPGTGTAGPWREAVASVTDEGGYGENVRDQLLTHGVVDAATGGEAYGRAQSARARFTATIQDRLEEYDVLVTPTTPVTAPEFGEITDDAGLLRTIANTAPFNLTGHPALSVPCGTVEGRPVGLQVVADYFAEATAVAVGSAVVRRGP